MFIDNEPDKSLISDPSFSDSWNTHISFQVKAKIGYPLFRSMKEWISRAALPLPSLNGWIETKRKWNIEPSYEGWMWFLLRLYKLISEFIKHSIILFVDGNFNLEPTILFVGERRTSLFLLSIHASVSDEWFNKVDIQVRIFIHFYYKIQGIFCVLISIISFGVRFVEGHL